MVLIDNYDSFTYNIVEYFEVLGENVRVFKNDEITIEELQKLDFEKIVLSPGPSNPTNAGITLDVIKNFYQSKAILGVCLGHQAIAQYFGAKIVKAKMPVHGKVSKIFFDENEPLFNEIEQGFLGTRYHSLIVDNHTLNSQILPIAHTEDNILMGLKIKDFNCYGVQFHPESILSEFGLKLFENFLKIK